MADVATAEAPQHNAHVRAFYTARQHRERLSDDAVWAGVTAKAERRMMAAASQKPRVVLPDLCCSVHATPRRDCMACAGITTPVVLVPGEGEVKHGKQCLCLDVARRPADCDVCGYRGHMCGGCGKFTFGKCRRAGCVRSV